MSTRQEALIKKVQEFQKGAGWSDGQLCGFLEIDQGQWSKVKNLKLDFPKSLLETLSRKLPGLQAAVMEYMASPYQHGRASPEQSRGVTATAKKEA